MSAVSRKRVVARKRHACEVCPVPIERGDVYVRVVTFDGGDVLTWKACEPCQEATDRALFAGYDDGGFISAGAVQEWACERLDTDTEAANLIHRLRDKEHAP